jgi:hypothetical protein
MKRRFCEAPRRSFQAESAFDTNAAPESSFITPSTDLQFVMQDAECVKRGSFCAQHERPQ